ncbi:hypothetical protein L6164_002415 [Bauhinia variegata]|uniref:Uncharacterized protein n=1 Tax=Bauhinia variegata TaxID=167791 RepID=A0ACB9PXZ0_BAUVA|nr:hypothetical protein L6164_002415 [Bauhinia variegata]
MISVMAEEEIFERRVDPKSMGMKKRKLSHFRFYWHDTLNGTDPSSVTVVKYPANSTEVFAFGFMNIFDSPITIGPELTSKLVGRAEGFYFSASKGPIMSLYFSMNLAFTEGKYNGSTLTLLGRNPIILGAVRELPVIGGNGLFRFATGYAQISTYWFDNVTKDAIVEYNVFAWHF